MKRLLLILLLFPLIAYSQRPTRYTIIADSFIVKTLDDTRVDLRFEAVNKDSINAVLTNIGNGNTQFKKLRLVKINDTSFVLKVGTVNMSDTIRIPVSYGSGGGANTDTQRLTLRDIQLDYFGLGITRQGGEQILPFKYSQDSMFTINDSIIGIKTNGRRWGFPLPSGDNIYNSDGTIPAATNRIATIEGALNFSDWDNYNFITIGDSLWFPSDSQFITGSYVPFDGPKMTKFDHYGGEVGSVTAMAWRPAGIPFGGIASQISASTYITPRTIGMGNSIDFITNRVKSEWTYLNSSTNEFMMMDLTETGGFRVTPYDFGAGLTYLGDTIFSVRSITGQTIFYTLPNGTIGVGADVHPKTDNVYDLGHFQRWFDTAYIHTVVTDGASIYLGDAHLTDSGYATGYSPMSSLTGDVVWRPAAVSQYEAPTTGQTVNITTNSTNIFINPAGSLLALTLDIPVGTFDGQELNIIFTQAITTLSTTGATLLTALTNPILGTKLRLIWSSALNKWC